MIQSVVRALRILETIHSKGTEKGIGLVQIARELDMERSTVYNLVKEHSQTFRRGMTTALNMLVIGTAGTGKSFLIDALVQVVT